VLLSTEKTVVVKDQYPLNVFRFHPLKWMQDIVAPFAIFMEVQYESKVKQEDGLLPGSTVYFESRQIEKLFSRQKEKMNASVEVEHGRLKSFSLKSKNKIISAICKA
jgi:hypothetical protein